MTDHYIGMHAEQISKSNLILLQDLSPSRGIDVLMQLLSAGADTNLKNKMGNYPLYDLVSEKKGENEI